MTEVEPTRQSTRRISRRRLIFLAIIAGFVLSLVIAFVQVHFGWNWTGFSTRTLWDWLELLLVPLLLAGAGAYLNYLDNRRKRREDDERAKQQKREDEIRREQQHREEELDEQRQQRESLEARRRDEERYREETVRKYFDDMAYLMVEKGLLELVQSVESEQTEANTDSEETQPPPEPDPEKLAELLKNPVWRMAQTRTITVLRRMAYKPTAIDTETETHPEDIPSEDAVPTKPAESDKSSETIVDVQRANEILDFLRDSGLLTSAGGLLLKANLKYINLRSLNLVQANLFGASLWDASLQETNFIQANLSGADLRNAKLSDANWMEVKLKNAILWKTDMSGTDLVRADLTDSHLNSANLSNASLAHANLYGTNLWQVNLSGTELQQANLSIAYLGGAELNDKTVLPDARFVRNDSDGKPVFDKYYELSLGPEQMERYTNPDHPDFWQPEWVKQQANNNDEDTE